MKRQRWLTLLAVITLVVTVTLHPISVQAQSLWQRLLIQGIQMIQLSNINPQQEVAIGQQINQQMIRQGMRLYTEPNIQGYVNQIGQRLISVGDRPNIPYTFQVINDRQVNAYATMGGFVYVTTGLMATAENEAELASVIAHEIGHIEKRHVIRQMQRTAVAQGLMTAAGLDRDRGVQMAAELAFRRPRSREDEYEADSHGLILLSRGNYSTSAMPAFLRKLGRQGSPPTILSTHPAPNDRIVAVENMIRAGVNNLCTENPGDPQCGTDPQTYRQTLGLNRG